MRTLTPSRLEQDTPKWPEVRITLGDQPTVTVSGIVTPVDDETAAIIRCVEQARTLGRPIRVRITTAGGNLRRLIVDTDSTVTALAPPTSTAHAPNPRKAVVKKTGRRHGKGLLSRFPEPLRPVIRWGAPAMGLLVVSSVVVMVLHGRGNTADADAPAPAAPVPSAGRLYTENAPPGWSQNANWVIDLAKDAPTPVVASDGTVVAVTARDDSAVPTAGDDRYLSILEPNGQTRWAVPLDTAPKAGPLVLSIDGEQVVLVTGSREVTYWPLTGGPETVVPLPANAKITATGLITLPGDHIGYLHSGALQTIDGLPRTNPAIALDGAVLVTQPDTGAWWTLTATTTPEAVHPAPPAGAATIERLLAAGPDQILLGWTTAKPQDCIAAAYHRTDGSLIAATTAACSTLPRAGAVYTSNGTLAGVGPLIQVGVTMKAVPGLTVTTVVDQIYGTTNGTPVVVSADGQTSKLPDGTLIPIGQTGSQLLVVGSTGRLYALAPVQ